MKKLIILTLIPFIMQATEIDRIIYNGKEVEVYDHLGKYKFTINTDGSINDSKTKRGKGRNIK
ncbi:hypothetical protein [Streptobacillus canis]|uniref:hypothetical protein n=1 Tax=Streptobacillus canis TaxID=2678686 RepID=UPI0012E14B7C|nr:hypothetical protein [Streptobacillus canis]